MNLDETQEPQEPQEPPKPAPPKWPLAKGQAGFYRPVRSGAYVSSGEGVALIQAALGVPRSGTYDEATAEAVRRFKSGRKGMSGDVVDRRTWDAIFR